MKKIILSVCILISCNLLQAQTKTKLNDLLNQANQILNGATNNNANNQNVGNTLNNLLGGNLSNTDIVSGLKEALRIGTQNAGKRLNIANGFFGNQLIKIMLPDEVKNIETTLRQFGLGRQCDRLILSLNRAAEDAAGKAVPIFVNAITSMSITDGLNILRGGQNAATNFLKSATSQALTQAFRPVIQNSLNKVNAPALWKSVFNSYNRLKIVRQKVNTDLTGYVTEKALNGLFATVAQEEANIRSNPAARVTSLLQKVFGG